MKNNKNPNEQIHTSIAKTTKKVSKVKAKKTIDKKVLIRFKDIKDIALVSSFLAKVPNGGKSQNAILRDIIIEYIEMKIKKELMDPLANDLFAAMNKAIFTRTQAINKMLIKALNPIEFEVKLINRKVDYLINIIAGIANIQENIKNSYIPAKDLIEDESFKSLRNKFELKNNKLIKNHHSNNMNNAYARATDKTTLDIFEKFVSRRVKEDD